MQNRNAFDKSAGNDELKMLKIKENESRTKSKITWNSSNSSRTFFGVHYFQAEITWSLPYFQMLFQFLVFCMQRIEFYCLSNRYTN
jgi:hypothetical protein